MIQKPSLLARMVVAYQSYGSVILTTIAVTIRMNPLTCVDNVTVQLVGRDVLEEQIIVVYPNGCSVMVKTIVVTVQMNYLKTVQNVNQPEISNVKTIDVFQKDGYVILKMTVVTTRMSLKIYVKDCIDNVQNLNSSVPMENVYQDNGDVITTMIVVTTQMSSIVEDFNVKMALSSVRAVIALHHISAVTETEIAETLVTKLVVPQDIPGAVTALLPNLNAKPPNYVYSILNFVMAKTIVVTVQMKRQIFVVS